MSETADDQEANRVPQNSVAHSQLLLFCKGLAMGLGDSVPGVSGGTIAVITNIYDKLIFSITSIDLVALKLIFSGRIKAAWQHFNGSFLAVLSLCILAGLVISANTVLYLLENEFEALMAFFLGLVLASCWLLKQEFDLRRAKNLVAMCVGAALTIVVGMIAPRVVDLSLLYLFFSAAIAICAMILPGLSGAFILLLLGVYEFILGALIELELLYILVFVAGCVTGLLLFSRLLAWLLSNYHQLCYGCITGMLVGSVSVLWPWQYTQSAYTDAAGTAHLLLKVNVLPTNYVDLTGSEPALLLVSLCALGGALLVLLLHRVFNSKPALSAS
jgi:putative membrane protein